MYGIVFAAYSAVSHEPPVVKSTDSGRIMSLAILNDCRFWQDF